VGSTNSDVATLSIGYPPLIMTQPLSQTNIQGSNVVFSVDASGSQPLVFQWFLNGAALSDDAHRVGTTNATLTIAPIAASDAGTYTATATNAFGAATSSPATLTVLTPPAVTKQPVGRSVPAGLPTAFTVGATGSAPLSYQWHFNGADIPGATTTSYTVASVTADTLGSYSVTVTNSAGTTNSVSAALTFGPVAGWGLNGNNECLPPPGLSNVVAVAVGSGTSYALLTDGSLVKWGVNRTVNTSASNLVAISMSYNDVGVGLRADGTVIGINRTVSTAWTNMIGIAAGPFNSYALRADGTVVSSTQSVPNGLAHVTALAASGTQVAALINDGTVVVWTDAASISLLPPPTPVTNAVAIACGFNASFAVKSDGTIIGWGTNSLLTIPAAATNVIDLSVSAYPATGNGIAAALRRDGTMVTWGLATQPPTNVISPSSISNVVAVSAGVSHALALISDGSPQILRPPIGITTYTGRDATLRVQATGAPQLAYQWYHDGNPMTNATNAMLVLVNAQSSDAGSYHVVVTNPIGSVTSLDALVRVTNSAPFTFGKPANVTAYVGSKVTLGFPINGSGPMSLQWRFHPSGSSGIFTNIPGATNDELVFNPLYATNGGSYSLLASNSFGVLNLGFFPLTVRQVVAWGDNTYGKTNVPTSLTNAIAVCGGGYYNMLALRDDGSLVIWGLTSPATPAFTNLTEINGASSGGSVYLGLTTNGTVIAGGASSGFSNAIATLSNIVAMESDLFGSTFLKPDGTIIRLNASGATNALSVSNVVALSPWDDGFQALRADGTVFSSGSGGPVPVVTNVACAAWSRYAGTFLKRDQTIVDFGHSITTNTPTNSYFAIASSASGSELGVRVDGGLYSWGGSGLATNIPAGLPKLRVFDGGYNGYIALCTAPDFLPVFLHTALNTSNFVVTSRNSAQWYAQGAVTHDGVSAARSATIGRNTASSMRTLITNGPVTVGFWWKVSSETNHDFLTVSVGGVPQASISGEVDWQRVTVNVPAGPQMLVWTYSKDASGTSGQDAGWVDQVIIGAQPPFIPSQPQSQTVVGGSAATFVVGATGQGPLRYTWYRNNTNQITATGQGTNSITLFGVSRFSSGLYRVVVTNTLGSVTSSNAVLTVRTPQELQTPELQPDGTFLFTSGDVDNKSFSSQMSTTNFQAQYSSNLVDWLQLDTSLSISNGQIQFIDTDATNAPLRFYRVIEGW
ncbi:MAG: Immunoglobulin I-set domain protein, partial [Verrucomicrobiales bacterium]|nr:Immunoglobulin I-set domain protein [Verrucomicrobiales bacterium]